LFSFNVVTFGREQVTDGFVIDMANIQVESSVLDVIRCISSYVPVPRTLMLKFTREWEVSVVRATDPPQRLDLFADDDDVVKGRPCVGVPPKSAGSSLVVSTWYQSDITSPVRGLGAASCFWYAEVGMRNFL